LAVSGRPRWLAPALAAAALLLAAVLVLALTSGGGSGDGGPAASDRSTEATRDTSTATTETEQPAATTPAAPSEPPADTVREFYERAAADDFDAAWDLTGPGTRAQFGSFDRFVATVQTLESIEFPSLETTEQSDDSATVAFDSAATHTDRVDRCSGTVELTANDGSWRIDRLNVSSCDAQPRGAAPPSSTPGKGPGGGRPVDPGGKKPKKDKQRELRWGDEDDEGGHWDD
jgi:hypothetical protein